MSVCVWPAWGWHSLCAIHPFAYYCLVAGLLAFLYFAAKTLNLIP